VAATALALLADPDLDTRAIFRTALERERWTVEDMADGREARFPVAASTISSRRQI
jgi:hypothetical protein